MSHMLSLLCLGFLSSILVACLERVSLLLCLSLVCGLSVYSVIVAVPGNFQYYVYVNFRHIRT